MKPKIQKPWALLHHHVCWAGIFYIEAETSDSVTGFDPDREDDNPSVSYSQRAVLARFATSEHARTALDSGIAEWRRHEAQVPAAQNALRQAEPAREGAWLACMRAGFV